LGINENCHEWQLPLVTTAIDDQLHTLRLFMTARRFKTLHITLNLGTANISRHTVTIARIYLSNLGNSERERIKKYVNEKPGTEKGFLKVNEGTCTVGKG